MFIHSDVIWCVNKTRGANVEFWKAEPDLIRYDTLINFIESARNTRKMTSHIHYCDGTRASSKSCCNSLRLTEEKNVSICPLPPDGSKAKVFVTRLVNLTSLQGVIWCLQRIKRLNRKQLHAKRTTISIRDRGGVSHPCRGVRCDTRRQREDMISLIRSQQAVPQGPF